MAWRLASLVVVMTLLLALPTAAEGRSKSVKVRMPADGDISFARYLVKTAKPHDLTVRGARRLGSSMVVTTARALSRRRFEVLAMLVNPQGGASATQDDTFVDLIFESLGQARIDVQTAGQANDLLTQHPTPKETRSVSRACARAQSRVRRLTRRIRGRARGYFESRGGTARRRRLVTVNFTPEMCQDGTAAETAAAADAMRTTGVKQPPCTGTARPDAADPKQATVNLVCTQDTDFVAIRAQNGNQGQNCRGPTGSLCRSGSQCAPLPPESSCYFDPNGFDLRTSLAFKAHWLQNVDVPSLAASTPAPGATSVNDFMPLYLRHIWVPQGSP